MGYPVKLMNLSALLAKVEATYGTAIAVTATADGHLLALSDRYPGLLTLANVYDGAIGPAPGNLGMLKRVGTLGRTVSGVIPMRAKGNGSTATTAAYAATLVPNIHVMLQISGFTATLAAATYGYALTADGITYSSATMEYYKRGEKWSARGVLASAKMEITNAGVPLWSFDTRGICSSAIADSAVVAPTYPTLTTAEPLAAGVSMAIGTYVAPVIRSAVFNLNRQIDNPRINLNAADIHEGFVPGGYDPEIRMVVETPALTYPTASGGFDPYKMLINGESNAVSITVGSAVNNKYTISMPQAQLVDYTLQNDGPMATTELVFKGVHSSPIVQTDAVTITFN